MIDCPHRTVGLPLGIMIWPICRVLSNSGSVPVFLALFTPGKNVCPMNGYHLQKPENAAPNTPSSAPYVLQRCETLQGETDDNCGYVHSGMKRIVVMSLSQKIVTRLRCLTCFQTFPASLCSHDFFRGLVGDMVGDTWISATAMVPSFGDLSLKVHSNRLSGHVESKDRKHRTPSRFEGRCADQLT